MKLALLLIYAGLTYVSAQVPDINGLPPVEIPTVPKLPAVPDVPVDPSPVTAVVKEVIDKVSGLVAGAPGSNTTGGSAAGLVNGGLSMLGASGRTSYNLDCDSNEEDELSSNTVNIIAGYKYPVEEHLVSTDDGYIIKIFRIPCKKSKNPKTVLIMPDFYTNSDYWVLSGPKYALSFYLADLGYDIWIGNNRGNKYGQKHKLLKISDPSFWYYSVHEWGIYDLPAIINYIVDHNKCEKINYIGWGYGATEFFVMASEKPEMLNKVSNMQALGPLVFLDYSRCRIKLSGLHVDEETIYDIVGRDVLVPTDLALKMAGRDQCLKLAIQKEICDCIEPVAHEGYNIDITGYPEIACEPAIQGSMRFFLHFRQSMKKGFRQYDHGLASNLLYYGRECPPKYDINAADVPIALYYSDDDNIATSKDVLKLSILIPKLIRAFKIKLENFGFADFPFSKVGKDSWYRWIVEVIERYP